MQSFELVKRYSRMSNPTLLSSQLSWKEPWRQERMSQGSAEVTPVPRASAGGLQPYPLSWAAIQWHKPESPPTSPRFKAPLQWQSVSPGIHTQAAKLYHTTSISELGSWMPLETNSVLCFGIKKVFLKTGVVPSSHVVTVFKGYLVAKKKSNRVSDATHI